MNNIAVCNGHSCPNDYKNQCKRFLTHQEFLKRKELYPWYIDSPYRDNKCDLFLNKHKEGINPIIKEEYHYFY